MKYMNPVKKKILISTIPDEQRAIQRGIKKK